LRTVENTTGMIMDENVAKNDLLKELEAVVVVMRKGSPRQAIDAFDFLSTHHAEIAEAVKDARRYRFIAADHSVAWQEELDAAMHNSAREDGE